MRTGTTVGYVRQTGAMCSYDFEILDELATRHHEQVGGYILSKWGLHNMVKTVASAHHHPEKAGAAMPMALAVAAADQGDRIEAEGASERLAALAAMPICYQAGLTAGQIEALVEAIEAARADDVMASLTGA